MTYKSYTKKPVTISAWQFVKPTDGEQIANWCGGEFLSVAKASDPTDIAYSIKIPTLEGITLASLNDFVIRGVHGEFYACKPDIFRETYDGDF